jgi:hypothetical protein
VKKAFPAVLGILAVVCLVLLTRGPTVRSGGPVSAGAIVHRGAPVDVGVDESLGYLLKNEGKEPAIIERVRILGVTGPIEVLGLLARLREGGQPSFLILPGFPPAEYPAKPLAEEHVVPVGVTFSEDGYPNEGLELVVGVRATGEGFGRIRGIEVLYRVGDRRYHSSTSGYGMLCAPQKRFFDSDPRVNVEKCPDEAAAEDFDKKFVDFGVSGEGASR